MAATNTAYNPSEIESRWQAAWQASKAGTAADSSDKPKKYILVEFPYPSGQGLHVGHCLSYIAQDIVARYYRMRGYNVLYPMGWDAFGLPTENYAIKHKIKPQEATARNVATFKRQIQSLGISFDWSREINTTDPSYYRWTQWIFLQLFKHGLAEKREMPINWCPSCKIGLAFEEVVDGACERCGTPVERRTLKQWVLKITEYADRLIEDLSQVHFLPEIKQQQINWIGRSEGAEIKFVIPETGKSFVVFTTRPDTLFGATYAVLAPEHPLLERDALPILNRDEVDSYIVASRRKSDRERLEIKDKTGVELQGVRAINPATGQAIPIWVADYVLSTYGTGAIMAVPAHDERDNEFAKKFKLPCIQVITPPEGESSEIYTGEGILVHSGDFSGIPSPRARQEITEYVGGSLAVRYKLRDWIFSRQHYWGEPIPIIICDDCGYVPVPESALPVVLPDVEYYEPTDTGESPLSKIESWVTVTCPVCGKTAKRETDTMPNWAGSSWYFLRYIDPKNDQHFADMEKLRAWLPVDLYNGGAEHTTLHLLYSRFWHKFLFDIGQVPTSEPYDIRVHHGMILGPDGQKMSKSRGNVINPDDIIIRYGADAFRLYVMFMGEYENVKPWSDQNLQGVWRFLKRLWEYVNRVEVVGQSTPQQVSSVHALIKRIQGDLDRRSFNTGVSALMIALNELSPSTTIGRAELEAFVQVIAPFAPHLAEEVWYSKLGHADSVHVAGWPVYREEAVMHAGVTLGIQINGKVRAELTITSDMTEDHVREAALQLPDVQRYVGQNPVKKFIYIPNKIISIVV